VTKSKYPESELQDLMNADREFSKITKAKGASEAYKQFLAEKTRLMRGNQLPESDREKALHIVSKEEGTVSWEPAGGDVAASGDLGYTYGLSERTIDEKAEKGNYVRAWRKENGQWKVAVDLMTPY
jgi:hypothetical protein